METGVNIMGTDIKVRWYHVAACGLALVVLIVAVFALWGSPAAPVDRDVL